MMMSHQSKVLWGTFFHAVAFALGLVVFGLFIGLGLEYLTPMDDSLPDPIPCTTASSQPMMAP